MTPTDAPPAAPWLGIRPAPLPTIPASALTTVQAGLATIDSALRAGSTVHPPGIPQTAHVYERRCLRCRTTYGVDRLYTPLGAGHSARCDVLCIRSNCRSLTVVYVSDAGVSACLSAYEGGPSLNGHAGRVAVLSG